MGPACPCRHGDCRLAPRVTSKGGQENVAMASRSSPHPGAVARSATAAAIRTSAAANRKAAPGSCTGDPGTDEQRESLREPAGAQHVGDPHQAAVGALQLALLARAHPAAHQPERGRLAKPHSASNGMPDQKTRPVEARPNTAKPATPKPSPTISVVRSPKRRTGTADGQHRNDHAERQHVEQHGDEDENEGRRVPHRRAPRQRRGRLARRWNFAHGRARSATSVSSTDSSSRARSAGWGCRADRSSRADC